MYLRSSTSLSKFPRSPQRGRPPSDWRTVSVPERMSSRNEHIMATHGAALFNTRKKNVERAHTLIFALRLLAVG